MNELVRWPPTWGTILLLPAIFIGFTVHELAHALVAFLLGDTSQVERKRLSFNPLRHVSWFGMVTFLLFGFGWAKPVWVDYRRFRIKNRALGMFLVSISGATANLLVALVVLVAMSGTVLIVTSISGVAMMDVIRFFVAQSTELDLQAVVVALSYDMFLVNLVLALFNLLPIPPLDGFQAVMSLFRLVSGAIKRRQDREPSPRPGWGTADGGEPAPRPAEIHFDIALDYHKRGQLDQAIARYRQATEHEGDFALAYYNLGLAYRAQGRLPMAVSAFRAALQSASDVGLRIQADLRLRELAHAEQDPAVELGPAPPPLEPGVPVEPAREPPPDLDPIVVRQMWARLGIGGGVVLGLAIASWVVVTIATLMSLR